MLVAGGRTTFGSLTPHPFRLAEVTGQLRAVTELFENGEPPRFVLVLGPELERAPRRLRGVPVCVDVAPALGGGDESAARLRRLPGRQPVLGDRCRRRASSLHAFSD